MLNVLKADYGNPQHANDLIALLDHYARDPMGGAAPLDEAVKQRLVATLAQRPDAFSILAYQDGQPIGLINCFEGFSTFKCKPLINIHDVVVHEAARGTGVCQQMMQRVEEIALERGCCKLTLEVLEGNPGAQAAYRKFGFAGYELDPKHGNALFWEKGLTG